MIPNETASKGKPFMWSRIFKWYAGDFNDDIVGFFLEIRKRRNPETLERKGAGP